MLNTRMDVLNLTFAALADPTRRAILARLAKGEAHVGALIAPFSISGPAISRHLRVLEHAGLIEREANAQWRICRLRGHGLRAAHSWLDPYRSFWEESLDRLTELLEAPPVTSPQAAAPRKKRGAGSRASTPRSSSPRHRKA